MEDENKDENEDENEDEIEDDNEDEEDDGDRDNIWAGKTLPTCGEQSFTGKSTRPGCPAGTRQINLIP